MRFKLFRLSCVAFACSFTCVAADDLPAQGPVGPTPSSYVLDLEVFATHTGGLANPSGSNSNPSGLGSDFGAIDVAGPRDGSGRVFVSSQEGQIFGYDSSGASLGTFLDLRTNSGTTGFVNGESAVAFRGLMYFDFHPDFADSSSDGFGKVYTGYQVRGSFDNGGAGADYRIQDYQNRSGDNQYAIAEWTLSGANANQIDLSSHREVFRFQTEGSNPHALGEIAFNPNSSPGDDDYGLLYAALGDGSAVGNSAPASGYLQELDNPFGSIIRIDPLQDGADSYSIPLSNPYAGQAGAAEEIYGHGFRDPQTFSFGKDDAGGDVAITFDIGAAEREEISLVRSGGNYGWERFEGTRLNNAGQPLTPGSTHSEPVLEYTHDVGFAIIGGLRVTDPNDPDFEDKVLFSDLPTGKLFYADYRGMLDAEAAGGQVSDLFEINNFTENGNVVTENAGGGNVTLEDVFGPGTSGARGDARFGTDEAGNVYIVSKQTRNIYKTGLVAADPAPLPIVPPEPPQPVGPLVNVSLSSQASPQQITGAGVLGDEDDSWNEIGPAAVNGTVIQAGAVSGLQDSTGAATEISFAWSGPFQQHNPNNFGTDADGVTPIVNSWFGDDDDFDEDLTFTLSGLDPNEVVDLTLFGTFHFPESLSGGFNRGAQFTIGDQSLSTAGANGPSDSLIVGVNYVSFSDLLADELGELMITVSPSESAGQSGGGAGRFFDFNGFQLRLAADVLLGDFDLDGDVDLADLDRYVGNIDALATGELEALDLDGDGTVGANDLIRHYTELVETSNGRLGTFAGDANLDGTVDVLGDGVVLVANLGDSATSWAQGDFNADGQIDVLADAAALVGNLGTSNGGTVAASAVPEPGGWVLFVFGVVGVVSRRRRG